MHWFHYYKMTSRLLLWLERASLFVCALSHSIISRTAGSPPSPEQRHHFLWNNIWQPVRLLLNVKKENRTKKITTANPLPSTWALPARLISVFWSGASFRLRGACLVLTLPYRMSAVYLSGYKTSSSPLLWLALTPPPISLLADSVLCSNTLDVWPLCLWLCCLHTRRRWIDGHAGGGVDGCPLIYSSSFHHVCTVDK